MTRAICCIFALGAALLVLGVGGASADPPFWATLTPDCSANTLLVNVPDGHGGPVARIVSSNSTVDLSLALHSDFSWRGSDTFWVPLYASGGLTYGMSCSGSGFEMDLADQQRPPVSFTGATTAGAETIAWRTDPHSSNLTVFPGESELPFSAPINDDYEAQVSVTQGAVTLAGAEDGHKQTFDSSGTYDLGHDRFAPSGEAVYVETQPGPQAHWTIGITAAPLAVTGAAVSNRYIRPSGLERIHYTLSSDATVSVDVHGPNGTVRRLETDLKQALGAQTIHWDGLDDNRKPVPQGTYKVEIAATNVFGSFALRAVYVDVDTQPPRVRFGFGERVTPHQRLRFRISDTLSGWKTARPYLDGRASGFRIAHAGRNAFVLERPSGWSLGRHRLVVATVDRVGNRRTYAKTFDVR